jgi:hypothetical protein
LFWVTIGSNTNLHLTLNNLFSVVGNMVKKKTAVVFPLQFFSPP